MVKQIEINFINTFSLEKLSTAASSHWPSTATLHQVEKNDFHDSLVCRYRGARSTTLYSLYISMLQLGWKEGVKPCPIIC